MLADIGIVAGAACTQDFMVGAEVRSEVKRHGHQYR